MDLIRSQWLRKAILGIVVLSLAACGTQQLTEQKEELQSADLIPEDVNRQFQIQELSAADRNATPSPKAVPSPKDKSKPQKKAKAGKKTGKTGASTVHETAAPEAPASQAFEYPHRMPDPAPIWPGEEYLFDISYFGAVAGTFKFKVSEPKKLNDRKVYQITTEAHSSKIFSLFYRVNDTFDTFLDAESLFSHRFDLHIDESKNQTRMVELYDHDKQIAYHNSQQINPNTKEINKRTETKPLTPLSQDILSALFYLRAISFKEGTTVEFPVFAEQKQLQGKAAFVRREVLNTQNFGQIPTIVVRLEATFQGQMQTAGENLLWFSDDDRHFLVQLDGKVKVGSIKGKLVDLKKGTAP